MNFRDDFKAKDILQLLLAEAVKRVTVKDAVKILSAEIFHLLSDKELEKELERRREVLEKVDTEFLEMAAAEMDTYVNALRGVCKLAAVKEKRYAAIAAYKEIFQRSQRKTAEAFGKEDGSNTVKNALSYVEKNPHLKPWVGKLKKKWTLLQIKK